MTQSHQDLIAIEESISSLQVTKERVTNFPNKVRYDVMVPIGKVAFCPGQLIHTNEFKVLEPSQTEVDLPAIEIISHKDTAIILESRVEELQKKLAQIKQKYGIKQDNPNPVKASESSSSTVLPPAPQNTVQASKQSDVKPANAAPKPVGNIINEKEPSAPKPLKSALKKSSSAPKQTPAPANEEAQSSSSSKDSKNADHHVTFDNTHPASNTVVNTAASPSNQPVSAPAQVENIFEIREYINDEDEIVRGHELIDITKQLAHMENMQQGKPNKESVDSKSSSSSASANAIENDEEEKKEELIDPQAAMLDLLSPAPQITSVSIFSSK
jgi:hypothetical protein